MAVESPEEAQLAIHDRHGSKNEDAIGAKDAVNCRQRIM
jgi:hypothetical protein